MDRQKIIVIASHESRLIRRSFLFWVLWVVSVGGITLVQWLVQGRSLISTDAWLWHWQAFSLPLANAYLYNIVQAFILAFTATEVFTRAQQQGPSEALRTRPAGNGELFLGKAWGVIQVFLGMGAIAATCCAGMHLLGSDAPFQAGYYFFYFLTLTVPSLLFFTGLSLWLSWMTRSRVLTQTLLLAFLFCSVVVLPGVMHGVFDFTGSGLSNLFSAATGHVDGGNYALHRSGYLLLGAGLLACTVGLLQRLPNHRKRVVRLTTSGLGIFLVGGVLIGTLVHGYLREDQAREAYRAAFARHAGKGDCRVASHDITFTRDGDRIASTSDLTLRNPGKEPIAHPVLYLNPGLTIEQVEEAGKALTFQRDGQVVVIDRPLAAGDSARLRLRYAGSIDEHFAYLDVNDATYRNTRRWNGFFHFGRRHALVSDASVVLIPEVAWYPMGVTPVNPVSPALSGREYTRFQLRVVDPAHRVLLSQGERRERGDTVEFLPSLPLEGITLCGGDYRHASFDLSGLPVDIYYFEESDFLSPLFANADMKKLSAFIKQDITRATGGATRILTGERLTLVETPLPFVAHARVWKGRSERVQPGMLLFGERLLEAGGSLSPATFKRLEEDAIMRYPGQSALLTMPFTKNTLKTYVQHPFLRKMHFYETNTDGFDELNTHNVSPLFTDPALTLISARHGAIDRVLKIVATKHARFSQGMDMLDYNDIKALTYLQDHTIEEALHSREISPMVLDRLLEIKAKDLLARVERQVKREEFLRELNTFFATHRGEIPLDSLSAALQTDLGLDFEGLLAEWGSKELPRYRVHDLKVESYNREHVARFYIQNTGKVTGTVQGIFGRERESIVLAPGDCKRVSMIGHSDLFTLELGLSGNLPSKMEAFSNHQPTRDTTLGTWDVSPEVFNEPGTIVVDNDDPGFRLITPNTKLLQRYLSRESRYTDGFYGMAPEMGSWRKIHAGRCHGEYVRNAHIKTEGSGSFKAEWRAELPEEGVYEVFVWIPEISVSNVQSYTVSGEGMPDQSVEASVREGTWNSLGQFDLKQGKALVVLSDRIPQTPKNKQPAIQGRGMLGKPRIVADAVKWVRVKN